LLDDADDVVQGVLTRLGEQRCATVNDLKLATVDIGGPPRYAGSPIVDAVLPDTLPGAHALRQKLKAWGIAQSIAAVQMVELDAAALRIPTNHALPGLKKFCAKKVEHVRKFLLDENTGGGDEVWVVGYPVWDDSGAAELKRALREFGVVEVLAKRKPPSGQRDERKEARKPLLFRVEFRADQDKLKTARMLVVAPSRGFVRAYAQSLARVARPTRRVRAFVAKGVATDPEVFAAAYRLAKGSAAREEFEKAVRGALVVVGGGFDRDPERDDTDLPLMQRAFRDGWVRTAHGDGTATRQWRATRYDRHASGDAITFLDWAPSFWGAAGLLGHRRVLAARAGAAARGPGAGRREGPGPHRRARIAGEPAGRGRAVGARSCTAHGRADAGLRGRAVRQGGGGARQAV